MRLRTALTVAALGSFITAVAAAAQDVPRAEVSGGYQLLRAGGETIGAGWYGEVAGHVTPIFSVVGLVSGGYQGLDESATVSGVTIRAEGDASIHTFAAGARVSARNNPQVVPFGHVLVGAVRGSVSVSGSTVIGGRTTTIDESDSSTEFGLVAGGGVNIRMTPRLGLRVGADLLRVFVDDDDDDSNAFRFTAGVVIPFR